MGRDSKKLTVYAEKKHREELAVYNAYSKLIADGYMPTMATAKVMAKYRISSVTVWAIRKRVEERLRGQEGQS